MTLISDPRRRAALRRWTLRLHMYGGLLCSSYLVIYGVSSIRFNHPSWIDQGPRERVVWTRELSWPEAADDLERAARIREQLGLFGTVYEGTFNVSATGDLDFEVYRPVKNYRILTDREAGTVEVRERRRGVMAIFGALHGHGRVPGSMVSTLIWLSAEASWIFILFSASTGVYLWASRGGGKLRWRGVSAGAAVFFVLCYAVLG